jgi:uncharacterized coiled-coil protein SlyX
MADEPQNLVLEHLYAIRGDVGLLREGMQELTGRGGRLEGTLARLESSLADVHAQLAEHSVRFDRVNARLERIERRLDLVEARADYRPCRVTRGSPSPPRRNVRWPR